LVLRGKEKDPVERQAGLIGGRGLRVRDSRSTVTSKGWSGGQGREQEDSKRKEGGYWGGWKRRGAFYEKLELTEKKAFEGCKAKTRCGTAERKIGLKRI